MDNIVTVSVKYQNWDRQYTFLTMESDNYAVGDRAVVCTGTYEVVQIKAVHEERQDTENFDYKFLIARVSEEDQETYRDRMSDIKKENPSANRL